MCFSTPKVQKAPPPPNKLDTLADALKNQQGRRIGGMSRGDTNVTGGTLGGVGNVIAPGAGGKTKLGL